MFPSHIEVAESDESTFNRIGNVPEAVDGRREHFSPKIIDIFTICGYFCKPQKCGKLEFFTRNGCSLRPSTASGTSQNRLKMFSSDSATSI